MAWAAVPVEERHILACRWAGDFLILLIARHGAERDRNTVAARSENVIVIVFWLVMSWYGGEGKLKRKCGQDSTTSSWVEPASVVGRPLAQEVALIWRSISILLSWFITIHFHVWCSINSAKRRGMHYQAFSSIHVRYISPFVMVPVISPRFKGGLSRTIVMMSLIGVAQGYRRRHHGIIPTRCYITNGTK